MRTIALAPLVFAFSLAIPARVLAEDAAPKPDAVVRAVAPYAFAHAKPLDAKEESLDEAKMHTRLRVEFNGIRDDRVPAYLYVPKGKGPFPAILLQYGIGGNKKTDYIVAIGKQFADHGYVVLTIDSPNCGERRGKDKERGLFGALGSDEISHYCGDYSRAVDLLAARPEVDKERLGFVGISWGAVTGITYCAHDPRIKAVGSMVGGGNFLGLYNAKSAEKAARDPSKSTDPVFHVARIAPRPLLFINVTKDQLMMKPWAESLHKAAGPGAKVVWIETDHYFRGVDRVAICDSVIEFMNKGLSVKRGETSRSSR
ncbi:MAG: dienelactone hydrolase family protein [Gemmataceae bacterium]